MRPSNEAAPKYQVLDVFFISSVSKIGNSRRICIFILLISRGYDIYSVASMKSKTDLVV